MEKIDKNKIVFITIDWMKYYKGITVDDYPLGTGGSYPQDKKHEVNNFSNEDGHCYGYTPPKGMLNLSKICKDEIKKKPDNYKYIDNVLVVFIGSNKDGKGRKMVGFYVGATVYNKSIVNKDPMRIIKSSNEFAKYNIISECQNAFLIDEENRNIIIPFSKKGEFGYGQSNIWYANMNNEKTENYRNKIENYRNEIVGEIENIIKGVEDYENYDDERKYSEGKSTVREVSHIERNSEARKKCLVHYFPNGKHYKCQICGFDFEDKYGEIGKNFIEVHHIKSLATLSRAVGGEHSIDPINDLIPVCSNCHSMIHIRKAEPLPINKVKMLIEKNAK